MELGYAEAADMTNEEALVLYDKYAKTSLELMLAKIMIMMRLGVVCVSVRIRI